MRERDRVIFYNPHPGIGGATVRLPQRLVDVAKLLDGNSYTIKGAKAIISTVMEEDERLRVEDGCILLFKTGTKNKHVFRLIRFCKDESETSSTLPDTMTSRIIYVVYSKTVGGETINGILETTIKKMMSELNALEADPIIFAGPGDEWQRVSNPHAIF